MPLKIVTARPTAQLPNHPAAIGDRSAPGLAIPRGVPASSDLPSYLLPDLTAFQRRTVVFCVAAILFVLVLYEIVYLGFPAVVSCEVQSYDFLHQARGLTVELASINACGL